MSTMARCRVAVFGVTLMTAACASSEGADGGELGTPLIRAPTLQSEFTPVELEATIDNLVAEMNKSPIEPMNMAILLKNITGFFAPVATGANRAMGELGVTGNVIGPTVQSTDADESQALQAEQIREMAAGGAEGLGVAPISTAQQEAIEEAVANGVHVVTIDTDVAVEKRALYIGTLNGAAGATAGTTLLPHLPPPPGTVMIHGQTVEGWADAIERTRGAQAVLEEAGYTVVATQAIFGPDDQVDLDWMLPLFEEADPPVVGLLGLFNISYRCAMLAELVGQPELPVVAFDFDPKTVEFMREGRIKATHTQRQYYEGYLAPYILYGIKNIGLDATKQILAPLMLDDASRVNIGVDVVPGDKVDEYYAFLDAIGANQ
ncbi:sugar ABC transporter substrate-binding protein [Sorangium sp. So ce1335]|uniref:sugar ABC transporter substrate-binding protein n=1 Tax=Sorangium sp. So ce1335 TaxID=3133335 RepID=UPI003F61BEAD